MLEEKASWFSISRSTGNIFVCSSCGKDVDLIDASLDHHPSWCPACGVECLFWSDEGGNIQLIPEKAPVPLRQAIRWAQENLSELEFVELFVTLEEIFTEIGAKSKLNSQQ